ncbi:MAG TPA: DUF1214 domain-containing protein, partial [Acidimicrobiia bacterium]|nr:DUF1214 domain-containing protein [Acidimicrobiia bacterium]
MAWHDFCTRLEAVGREIDGGAFGATDTDRALATRHLARQVVLALQGELEHGDPRTPAFHRYEEPWAQWGGPNPDNIYVRAAIDPDATYVVRGNVRGVRAAIFSLCDGDMHMDKYGVFSERTLDTFGVEPDGELELHIGPTRQPGNWMATDPDARLLLIRQYQSDWQHDAIATFTIERADTTGRPPALPTSRAIDDALARAAEWVERSLTYWRDYADAARERMTPNTFGPAGTPKGGAPNIAYGAGWWKLSADEVLLVEFDVPDADYWSWTIHHRYRLDSGDFASRQTSLNHTQVHVDGDGKVRLAVAATDPGVPNWIDTEGRPEGMVVFRSVGTRTRPVPAGRVVPLDGLRAALP